MKLGSVFAKTPFSLCLILFAVIVLRLPNLFEPYWYGDEAIYLTLGQGVRQGLTLYKDIFDHKPPLIYLLAALSGSLFWLKFLLLISHSSTVFLFWKLAEKLFAQSLIPIKRQQKAILLATAFFALFTTLPLLEGNIANAELFMSLPVVAALLSLFSVKNASAFRLFLAGMIFSLAILYKAPAALEIAALLVYWLIAGWGNLEKLGKIFTKSLIFGSGVLVPILITVIYYALQGALSDYLAAGLLQNIGYIARWSAPATSEAGSIFSGNLTFRTIFLAGVVLLLFLFKRRINQTALFVFLWFAFSIFAMLLSARPYPHYIIQTTAPLALLLAILVNSTQKQRFWTTPLLGIFLASLVFYKFATYPVWSYYENFLSFMLSQKTHEEYLTYFDRKTPRNYRLAQFIVTSTSPQDKIFIWGTEPELYALSRRLPPGRFVTSFHISDFGGREETISALEKNHPVYILINTQEYRSLPGLYSILQSRYIYLQNYDEIEVWKLASSSLIRAIKK